MPLGTLPGTEPIQHDPARPQPRADSGRHRHPHDHDEAIAAVAAGRPDAAGELSARREQRLAIALALNVVIVVAQVVFGFVASSLGLIADAGHNLTDVAAILASLVAVRWARRRPTGQRSFGYHRATILAAQANAVSILVVTAWIVYEAVVRLVNPEPVHGGLVLIVALVAATANLLAALAVRESAGHAGHGHAASGPGEHGPEDGHVSRQADLNMRSAMLHLISDTAASIGVAVAGAVILAVDGAYWLDPVVSMGLGLLIAFQAWRLLRAATDVLLESTPVGIDTDALVATIEAMPEVEAVHDLHVWSLSSDVRALSAHIVMSGHPTLEQAQAGGERVKAMIGPRFSISHITLELECEACSADGSWCAIGDAPSVGSLSSGGPSSGGPSSGGKIDERPRRR